MKTFAMICAVVCAIGGTAFAQSVTDTLRVQIDRPVVVNGARLPAGQFTIQVLSNGGGSSALLLRSDSGAEAGVLANRIFSQDPNVRAGANVSLRRRGNDYILSRIWLSDNVGFQVIQPLEQ